MKHISDIRLAEYLSGSIHKEERLLAEKHLSLCEECLAKAASAHKSIAAIERHELKGNSFRDMLVRASGKLCLILAICSLILSFIVPHHFFQFLVVSLICGVRWALDSRSTKMIIRISEAWKKEGRSSGPHTIESRKTEVDDRL